MSSFTLENLYNVLTDSDLEKKRFFSLSKQNDIIVGVPHITSEEKKGLRSLFRKKTDRNDQETNWNCLWAIFDSTIYMQFTNKQKVSSDERIQRVFDAFFSDYHAAKGKITIEVNDDDLVMIRSRYCIENLSVSKICESAEQRLVYPALLGLQAMAYLEIKLFGPLRIEKGKREIEEKYERARKEREEKEKTQRKQDIAWYGNRISELPVEIAKCEVEVSQKWEYVLSHPGDEYYRIRHAKAKTELAEKNAELKSAKLKLKKLMEAEQK